jgi:tryptophanyl-tRNA synthetase
MSYDNIKDIIALGFDPEKTFIFINSQYMGTMYPNVMKIQRNINLSTLRAIFGL